MFLKVYTTPCEHWMDPANSNVLATDAPTLMNCEFYPDLTL
jgi:hypothetical protein